MGRRRDYRLGVAATTMALVTGSVLTGCATSAQQPPQQTVLIGVDLELTGAGSELGHVYQDALQLRVEQVNQSGLLGNRRLALLVLDNRTDSEVAATNIARLAGNPDVVAIITGGCDACALASIDRINQIGVPVVSLAAASEVTEPVDERRFIFKLGPDPFDVAQVLVSDLTRAGAESIGVIASDDIYGAEGLREMNNAADRAGIEIVVSESVSDEESIAAATADIVRLGPGGQPATDTEFPLDQPGLDSVVMWVPGPVSTALAVTLREQGYEGGFFLAPSAADELSLSGPAGGALEAARMVFTETLVIDGVIASSPAKAARQTWFRSYAARQGTYHAQASFAADAVEVIAEAINRQNSTSREAVRTGLENTQIDGLTGPIRFRLESHSGLSPQALVTLVAQGDRWRLAAS